MPKYVWELSAILPAEEWMSASLATVIAGALAEHLKVLLDKTGHPLHEVAYDDPFEHVTGDMLPADEHGVVKVGPSRPIDL